LGTEAIPRLVPGASASCAMAAVGTTTALSSRVDSGKAEVTNNIPMIYFPSVIHRKTK